MGTSRWRWLGAWALAGMLGAARCVAAVPGDERVVRLAELEIDPAQVEAYKAALREEIAASVRVEPGMLVLYAVAVKGHPDQIRLFEMYDSEAAYAAHRQTPHFLRYKSLTQGMVRSLKLVETDPVMLASKAR